MNDILFLCTRLPDIVTILQISHTCGLNPIIKIVLLTGKSIQVIVKKYSSYRFHSDLLQHNHLIPHIVPLPLRFSSKRLILMVFVCVCDGGRERGRIYSHNLQPPRSRLSGLSPSGTLAVLLLYCCPGCPSASGLGRPR